MSPDQLQHLLTSLANGEISVADALSRLRSLPFEQLPFATLDHHRSLRCGHAEIRPEESHARCDHRADDQTAAAPRSVSRMVARVVSWSGAVTSNTRSSRVAPPAVVDTQYATRLPVPETAPMKP